MDIALAALLGDGVYGFAQLLMHPIVKVLQDGSYAWLGEMLEVFNRWAVDCSGWGGLGRISCRLGVLNLG